ncbi:hypothetical protein ScPMuIL_014628 [Solemya velum]
MRLCCDVDLVNRLLPEMNMKKKRNTARAQLSIGKKPGSHLKDGTLFLMLCTAKDRNGAKYLIKGNVEQVFVRFVDEGKATIRFKNPQQDICINKADPVQLKCFLSVLRQAVQGKELDRLKLSVLAPASTKNVEKPKSKLCILHRKDYPLTTNFPGSLEQLQISQCRLKRIDSRIFQLKKLEILDLSENVLETISEEISNLKQLKQLILNHNQFVTFPKNICMMFHLQQCIGYLDFSDNGIVELPNHLCELKNLVTLKIDNNNLCSLPPTFGRLRRLKFFSASNNRIQILPAGFARLRLETVDLSGNPFEIADKPKYPTEIMESPDLEEICARAIRKMRVPYNEDVLLLSLCKYLDAARQCLCGTFCFRCSIRYTSLINLTVISTTVTAIDNSGRKCVPIEAFHCSTKCLARCQNSGHLYG